MKILIGCAILVSFDTVALSQGVLLTEGQSYVFKFSSISDVRPAVVSDRSRVIGWFAPGTLGQSEIALMEIFPDNLSDSPLSISGVSIDEFPSGRTGVAYSWRNIGPNAEPPFFPDLQGVVRMTMLSGTAQLSGFKVSQIINGEFYSGYFAVPEPAVGALFAAALACFPFFKKTGGDPQDAGSTATPGL